MQIQFETIDTIDNLILNSRVPILYFLLGMGNNFFKFAKYFLRKRFFVRDLVRDKSLLSFVLKHHDYFVLERYFCYEL